MSISRDFMTNDQNVSEDNRVRVQNLKRRIISYCDMDLRNQFFSGLNEIGEVDTEITGLKINFTNSLKHEQLSNEGLGSFEGAILSENELIAVFDRIIERVRSVSITPFINGLDTSVSNIGVLSLSNAPSRSSNLLVFKCQTCGNTNIINTTRDNKHGDMICLGKQRNGCGTILQDHIVDEGQEKRTFEDSEDQSHHGAAPDPFMPDHINMVTRSMAPLSSHSISVAKVKQFIKDTNRIERQVMEVGHVEDHRTTSYYKAEHKQKVFRQMAEIAYNLTIHDQVVHMAKILFARYRDAKERLQQEQAVLSACLVIAYEDLLKNDRKLNIDKSITYAFDNTTTKVQEEDQLKKLSSDIAVITVKDCRLEDWSWEQLEEWLGAILLNSNSTALGETQLKTLFEDVKIFLTTQNQVLSKIVKNVAIVEKVPIFGTTTIAGRNKLFKPSFSNKMLSPGPLIARHGRKLNLTRNNHKSLSMEVIMQCEKVIKEALRKRLLYESRCKIETKKNSSNIVIDDSTQKNHVIKERQSSFQDDVVDETGFEELFGSVMSSSSNFASQNEATIKEKRSQINSNLTLSSTNSAPATKKAKISFIHSNITISSTNSAPATKKAKISFVIK